MSVLVPILLTVHVGVCLLLVLVVLMQLPRSEGLGAAFGGGVTDNIFGAQTTHVLAKFTVWLGVAFFILTLLLAVAYSHQNKGQSAVQRELMAAPVPTPALATPAASTEAVVPATTPAAVVPEVAPAASSAAPELEATPVATPAPEAPAATTVQPEAAPAPAAAPAATP